MISYKAKVLSLFLVLLINGCGSNSSSDKQSRSSNEEHVLSSTDVSTTLSNESFVEGATSNDVVIPIESTDGKKDEVAVVTLTSGTQFTNAGGDVIEEAPTLHVVQRESSTKIEDKDEVQTSTVIKSEIKFMDQGGNKIIPTEPIEITMTAPVGAKSGDEVKVEMPNGVNKMSEEQKLTLFIVDKNGNIRVIVLPHVFATLDVVVVIIERVVVSVTVQPLTGAEGGS